MKLWQRVKNLWKLSEWEPAFHYERNNLKQIGDKISTLIQKQAIIVDLTPDVELE